MDKFNESFKARYTRARLPTIEVYIIMQKCLSISQDLRSIWGEAGGDHREGPSPPETPRTPLEALSGEAAAFPFNTTMENSLPPSEENLESSRYRWRNSHIFAKQVYNFFLFSPSLFGKDCDSSKLASALWGSSNGNEQDLDNCVVYTEAFLHLMGLAKVGEKWGFVLSRVLEL